MKNSSGFSYILSAIVFVAVISLLLGYMLGARNSTKRVEGFSADTAAGATTVDAEAEGFAGGSCNVCNQPKPSCGCRPPGPIGVIVIDDAVGPSKMNKALGPASVSPPTGLPDNCPARAPCPVPDSTKYVLKSTVPPCPPMPDMSRYMLKTECPSSPDMSKYVLKSSVPKCPPCISSCSKPCKIGECPPCPRPRCPLPNCPDPKPCPACPDVQVAPCPEPRVQCKAQYEPNNKVRPMLASTAAFGL